MKNACARSPVPAYVPAVSLLTVWDVDEGASYDVHGIPEPADFLVAIRTLHGHGRITLKPRVEHTLSANTLLVVERNRILRYRCAGPRWRFWRFEFIAVGKLHIPVGPILNVPSHRDDARNFRALFTLLNRPRAPQRAVASATFNTLLHRWAAHWEGAEARLPHRSAIESIIDAMPARLESGWSIRDMAKAAHMSERTFRDAFHSVTGQSPKGCFDRLRLSMAGELLKLGTLNVSEIAYRLGFSSPFHFSKAFKTFSGTPPSSLLPKPAARFRHE